MFRRIATLPLKAKVLLLSVAALVLITLVSFSLFFSPSSFPVHQKAASDQKAASSEDATSKQQQEKSGQTTREIDPVWHPPSNPLEEVARAISTSLTDAYVAFNAPEEIPLGESESIQLLLSPSASSEEELEQRITEAGTKEGDQIQVSNRMQARLTGSGFQIEAISPEEQAVSPTETTEWEWDITPTQTGEQKLHLTLTALIDVGGRETPRQIRSFDRTIDVNVTWGQRLGSVGAFITSHWEWVWTVLLVPIGLWIYGRYKKSKQTKKST